MKALIIEKNGDIKNILINDDSIETLCKKISLKNIRNFQKRTEWKVKLKDKKYNIHLYSKNEGRASTENKYDFPPPVDNELYFGNCILLNYENDELSNLTQEEWLDVYEKLFGGFENLNDTLDDDELEEDELDDIPDEMKTKDGYLKDGFVVDDDICNYDSELDYEEYEFSDED